MHPSLAHFLFKKSWENLEIAELVTETSLTWNTFAVSIRIHSSGKHLGLIWLGKDFPPSESTLDGVGGEGRGKGWGNSLSKFDHVFESSAEADM